MDHNIDLTQLLQDYEVSFIIPGEPSSEEHSEVEDNQLDFEPGDASSSSSEAENEDEFAIFNNEHLAPVTKGSRISKIMLVLLYLRYVITSKC